MAKTAKPRRWPLAALPPGLTNTLAPARDLDLEGVIVDMLKVSGPPVFTMLWARCFCGRMHFVDDDWAWRRARQLDVYGIRRRVSSMPLRTWRRKVRLDASGAVPGCAALLVPRGTGDGPILEWRPFPDGPAAVVGCCCDTLARLAAMLWQQRHVVASYYGRKVETMEEAAEHVDRMVAVLTRTKVRVAAEPRVADYEDVHRTGDPPARYIDLHEEADTAPPGEGD